MSLPTKGRKHPADCRHCDSVRGATWNRGRVHGPLSEERKAALSLLHKGKKRPASVGLKVSAALRGKKHTEQTRLNMAAAARRKWENHICSPECRYLACKGSPNEPTAIERTLRAWFPEGAPEHRVRVSGSPRARYRIDVALVDDRIALEADGAKWHDPFFSNERDVKRDADLVAQGWFILRLSGRTLTGHAIEEGDMTPVAS